MSWLTRVLGMGNNGRDPGDDFWYKPIGHAGGTRVTHTTAMQASVVFACVKVLSESESSLPLSMFERLANGEKRRLEQHPLHEILHDQANDEQTSMEFRETMQAWVTLRGTAVAEIVPGRRGPVDQLIPLHPDWSRWVEVRDGQSRKQWQLEYREPGLPVRRLLRSELFVLRAMMTEPGAPAGIDPISAEAVSIGATIAANDYARRFFENDARPSLWVEHPGTFKDNESRKNWIEAFRRAFTGAGRHRAAVLEQGAKLHQLSISPEQAQFLETRKYHDTDIARIFRVPPHMVGILDRATFSNIEQQAIDFVVHSLRPWLVRWEQAIRRDLILAPGRFFAEHNVAGLLRGDIESRYRAYAVGRSWGWLSANEVRKMENLNGIGEDGDIYLQPQNMAPAGAQDAGNGQADPRPVNGTRREGTLWTPTH